MMLLTIFHESKGNCEEDYELLWISSETCFLVRLIFVDNWWNSLLFTFPSFIVVLFYAYSIGLN